MESVIFERNEQHYVEIRIPGTENPSLSLKRDRRPERERKKKKKNGADYKSPV